MQEQQGSDMSRKHDLERGVMTSQSTATQMRAGTVRQPVRGLLQRIDMSQSRDVDESP